MKNFNWRDFKSGKFAVNCKTEEAANDFLDKCIKNNIKWANGFNINGGSNKYGAYKEDTCYDHRTSGLSFGTTFFYNQIEGFKVIEWEIDKYISLQEAVNMEEGTVFNILIDDRNYEVKLVNGDFVFDDSDYLTNYITVKELLDAKFEVIGEVVLTLDDFKIGEKFKIIDYKYNDPSLCYWVEIFGEKRLAMKSKNDIRIAREEYVKRELNNRRWKIERIK